MLDCDTFLTNPNILNELVSKNKTIVAPMLKSDALYSNFWHGMTEDYYYQRTEEYTEILDWNKIGCFTVPMVHSAVFIDLRRLESNHLSYDKENLKNYNGPIDDIIIFATSAKQANISMEVCNDEKYGFLMVPLDNEDDMSHDLLQLTNLKLEVLVENPPLYVNKLLANYTKEPKKDTMGFDKVYVINLKRRPERRVRMINTLNELGLEAHFVEAVDGKSLDGSVISSIKFLPGYEDPYHKRKMTKGEIGCFLSHYNIWNDVR